MDGRQTNRSRGNQRDNNTRPLPHQSGGTPTADAPSTDTVFFDQLQSNVVASTSQSGHPSSLYTRHYPPAFTAQRVFPSYPRLPSFDHPQRFDGAPQPPLPPGVSVQSTPSHPWTSTAPPQYAPPPFQNEGFQNTQFSSRSLNRFSNNGLREMLPPHAPQSMSMSNPLMSVPEPQPITSTSTSEVADPPVDAVEYDDKRRRNTDASARFRIRKKQRILNLERSVTDLTGRATELEREAAELRRENNWLKEILILKGSREAAPSGDAISAHDNEDDNSEPSGEESEQGDPKDQSSG